MAERNKKAERFTEKRRIQTKVLHLQCGQRVLFRGGAHLEATRTISGLRVDLDRREEKRFEAKATLIDVKVTGAMDFVWDNMARTQGPSCRLTWTLTVTTCWVVDEKSLAVVLVRRGISWVPGMCASNIEV